MDKPSTERPGIARRRVLSWGLRIAGMGVGGISGIGACGISGIGAGGPAAAATALSGGGTDGPVLVISTENSEAHVQTRVLRLFAERAEAAMNGAARVEVAAGATLFRDRDVPDALAGGRVAMAAPGIWHLGQHLADFNIPLLPMFYGQPPQISHVLMDGAFGKVLGQRLERAIGVRVLGRFIDLGHAHVFTRKVPVRTPDDYRGLRIRVPGGRANRRRLEVLGADPLLVPWPELPAVLQAGGVDGTLTTAATVVSGALWEKGLDHACLDRQYFPQYVPMISGSLWDRMPVPIRDALVDAWESVVDEAREMARIDQSAAIDVLASKGMAIAAPPFDVLDAVRARLMPVQEELVRDLDLDPELVAMAERVLR